MNASLRSKRPLTPDTKFDSGSRKTRKGTASCWECKRRKVRCCYSGPPSNTTCDACKRRKTTCISQEFQDQPAKVDSNKFLCSRLTQLETAIRSIVELVKMPERNGENHHPPSSSTVHVQAETRPSSHDDWSPVVNQPRHIVLDKCHLSHHEGIEPSEKQKFPTKISLVATSCSQASDPISAEYEVLSHMLVKAWPRPGDLEIILNLPDESLGLFHGTMCAPLSVMPYYRKPTLREDLQLPPAGSHPVLFARKFLILATYLQSLPPDCVRRLDKASVDHRAIMSSAVGTVHSCVTSNDELLESVEGIESVMIETMYQSNAGNLRTAWHLTGRAILIAQMMGFHRGTGSQPLKFLDTETRMRVHPEYLWFRLVQMNRYLSLMLGLPQGTNNNNFADCMVLEGCTPVERMQRMDCAAGGYILQRNEAGLYDNITTCMIDQMLQNSAALLSPTWWLVPNLRSSTHDEATIGKLTRAIDQLTHYHLVSQLHLPNLLKSHADHKSITARRQPLMPVGKY